MTDRSEILKALYARRTFGIKPGLEVERALLKALGNPHESFSAIHVAGTNGKGSVCAMLDAMIRAAGIRCGRYTSPHLVRFNERFVLNGREVADDALFCVIDRVNAAAKQVEASTGIAPTFFECSTAIAFTLFAGEGVSIVVVETGLGGRLDATNVLMPLISVITRVGEDHREWLGDTLEAIATEKAGIIKNSRPVVLGALPSDARDVILSVAASRKAPVIDAAQSMSITRTSGSPCAVSVSSPAADYGKLCLPSGAPYQMENAATAIAAFELFGRIVGADWLPEVVKRGLTAVSWRARFDCVKDDPTVIVDGAHNPDGAAALRDALKAVYPGRPVGLVIGLCADKDAERFLNPLRPVISAAWCVDLDNPRNLGAASCAALLHGGGADIHAVGPLAEAIPQALQWAQTSNGVVVVCGSLFLAGECLRLLESESG